MGASGSADNDKPSDIEKTGERVRRVLVAKAGLEDVNGIYVLARKFAGAEMLVKEGKDSAIGKIYIRRRAEGKPEDWVITLSPDTDTSGEHLYKRSGVKTDQVFPPLFGWEPCTTAEGVPGSRAAKLYQGRPKLEYHYGPVESGPGAMSSWQEWDQQDTSSSLLVCVIGANNIPDSHASKFHCTFQVPDKNEIIESPPVQNSTDPVWKFKSPLRSWNHPDCLQFTVYANSNIKIGEASLNYAAFRDNGFVGKIPLKLYGSDDPNATVNVCVTMPGQLTPGIDVELRTGGGAKIGIEVAMESNTSLSIVQIAKGGLVDLWNVDHPEQRVNVRDIITEIDGTRGTCYDLLSKLAAKAEPRTIQMKVQRIA